MAVTNFIQQIWSKNIQDNLELKCKLVPNCLQDYEGDVKQAGSVKILGVGEPTIKAYDGTKDMEYEDMSDKGQVLAIDQANAFGFLVDDVDQAQSVPGLMERYQEKAVHGLAVKRDSYVAGLIKSAENNNTAKDNTPEGVKNAIDEGIVKLRERNFDEDGVIEITPAVYNKFKNHLITLSTNNPEYIKKGIVGMYDGFEVVMSNNLAKDATYEYCDIRGKKAIAFAGQINEVEALRHPFRFKDIVRGLDTFGAKIIDEARIQRLNMPLAAAEAA